MTDRTDLIVSVFKDAFEPLMRAEVVVDLLGRATARVHGASDEDSDQDLVEFQVEEAVVASLEGRREDFIDHGQIGVAAT